jgi:hypothetical protein
MQFLPISRHIIPLWSKYSRQHPVLQHTQSMFPVPIRSAQLMLVHV